MLEFEVREKVLNVGNRKGQTVHFAQVKSQSKMGRRAQRPCQPLEHRVRRHEDGHERGPSRAGQLPPQRPVQDDGHGGGGHRGQGAEEPENHLHAQAEDARRRQCGGTGH